MERQFTATLYIIEEEKVLLIFHRKLEKWLPPGGHLDPNESPAEAAIREAFEETGLVAELISTDEIWIDQMNAKSIHRPYICLLEEIPAYKDTSAHQHIDMVYVGRKISGTVKENGEETAGIRWFSRDDIEQLEEEVEIFRETKQVAFHLLKTFASKELSHA